MYPKVKLENIIIKSQDFPSLFSGDLFSKYFVCHILMLEEVL